MSFELVLLVPVLVLLTVFVLWAGRGGRVALTADLAAEEAAAAAALCCEEGAAGGPDRDVLVEEMLGARPWLEFLCVGGVRPEAPAEDGVGPDGFVGESWLEFEPGSGARSGGVGVLGVRFSCETDGAVAPLRGLFPTVTFHGQASEVVVRRPPIPGVGFESTVFRVNEHESELVLVVTSPTPVPQDIRVDYVVSSADPNLNYTLASPGSVTMTDGTNSATIRVVLDEGDTLHEGTETLSLALVLLTDPSTGNAVPATVAELDPDRTTATGEVLDDDPPPYLFVSSAASPCQVTEGGAVTFEVRLRDQDNNGPAPSASTVEVDVTTEDDTATAGTDYTALSLTTLTGNPVTFNPGDDTVTVTVQTLDDSSSPVGEPTETFKVVLANANGAPLGDVTEVTCEIVDDEVRVTVADAAVDEGDQLIFELSLDRDPSADITVDYRLVDHNRATHRAERGSGCAGAADYLELSGSITIPSSHDHSQAVDLPAVTTCEDVLVEHAETFWLEISIPAGGGEAVVERGAGAIGTIRDDDIPTVSIVADPADATGTEGQTEPLKFTVSLTVNGQPAQLSEDITVDYALGGSAATATAPGLAGADYAVTLDTAVPAGLSGSTLSGRLAFTAATSGVAAVTEHIFEAGLLADHLVEGDETFVLDLDNLIDPVSAAVFEDTDGDPNTDDSHIGATIVDDPPPVLSVGDFRGDEGSDQSFTVTLANPRAGETVTVDYVIAGAGTDPATDPAAGETLHDYTAASGSLSGTLTFPDGAASLPDGSLQHSVGVSLRRDAIAEVDETLRLVLSDPVRAVLADRDLVMPGVQAYGQGIIGNIVDANGPLLVVDNTFAREGETLTFTITLCNPIANEDVTVKFKTLAHSAAAGRDYVARDGTLTFPDTMVAQEVTQGCGVRAGDTADAKSLTVDVATLRDTIQESDEEVHLVLSDQTPAHVGFDKSIGVGQIINVSAATVRVSNPTAVEGSPLGFVISLKDETGGLVGDAAPDATITQSVTVYYATQDRTATAGADYTSVHPAPGPCLTATPPPANCPFVIFDAASTVRSHPVLVTTHTDTEDENDETVALVLRLAAGTDNAGLGDAEGTGTIEDADPPAIRIDHPPAVREADPVMFTVSLHDEQGGLTSTNETVTVQYTTLDRTAQAGLDYEQKEGEVTFNPGDRTQPLTVQSLADGIWESEETFRVDLSAPVNAILERAVGIGTIRPDCVKVNPLPGEMADNLPPEITVHDFDLIEGQRTRRVFVSFSRPLCDDFYLQLRYVPGTATCADGVPCASAFTTNPTSVRHDAADSEASQFLKHTHSGDDGLHEGTEEYYAEVNWGPDPDMPAHYQNLPWARGTITITDDDRAPRLQVQDADASAGNSIHAQLNLDAASALPVTLEYRTVDITAVAGEDYTATAGWQDFTIPAFTTYSTISVPSAANSLGEGVETFRVEIRDLSGATFIDDGVAIMTIRAGREPFAIIYDASGTEGHWLRFRVRMVNWFPGVPRVSYRTVERPHGRGAAIEGADYDERHGYFDFHTNSPPGTTMSQDRSVRIWVRSDYQPSEPDETFLVEIDSTDVAIFDSTAVGLIERQVNCVDGRDDTVPMPPVTLRGTTAAEDSGAMTMTIRVAPPMCQPYEFLFETWNLGAVDGVDFLAPAPVNLGAIQKEVSFDVVMIDDDLVEGDETFGLRMSAAGSPGLRNLADTVVFPTITDDDVATLSLPAAGETSTAEGGHLSFVVRLDKPTRETVTFAYETADGSVLAATAGADYAPVRGTATIAPGELSVTVVVRTIEDALDEDDENLELRISSLTGAQPDPDGDVAVGTIIDDDDPPAVRVSDASADEAGALEFVVTLSAPIGRQVSVPTATRDHTATAGDDYVSLASTHVVFAPGETRRTIRVRTLADTVVESAEVVWLDLGPMGNGTATIGDGTGRGVIRDTSDRRVSVSDASVTEGGTLAFEVGFSEGPSSRDVTVRYRTRAGTASAGGDYDGDFESATRELKIVAGETSATVFVPTVDDGLDEDNETLELVLSSPVGAVFVGSTASGVIIDNDPEPALSVSDTEAFEADGASAAFTLSLSEASGRNVTVTYGTADVTAAAGADYTAPAAGAMETITAGSTTATVSVPLVNDDAAEDVETFRLEVTGAANAQRDDSVGVATVIDDDGLVQILVDDPDSVYEGDGASVVFTVRLSRADGTNPVTVAYSTADGTATAGADYTAPTSQTLTFAATDTGKTVSVPLINDDVVEDSETFRLVLSSPSSNADLGYDQATVLILDDDSLPTLSVADAAAQTEGSTATFTVTLSSTVSQEVTVDYATVADPTAAGEAAATPGQDYTATSGTLTIAARSASAPVSVPLLEDSLDENTETFWLRLSNPVGTTVLDGTATGTVNDDDPLPELSIADAGATEGGALRFEVSLTPVSGRTVTVPWTTGARPAGVGAASPGSDYTAASGTLTFSPGTAAAQVEVVSLPDDVSEADETFLVQLGTPANAALDDGAAVGAIRDDDGLPRIFIADTTVDEDAGPAIFSVTLSHPSSQPVTVGYSTADGTATDPDDYAPDVVRTLTIPAAFTGGEISVFIADDALTEGTETFTITLTNPVNAVIAGGAGTATGTISDDDGAPRASLSTATATEGDATIEFPVTLNHAAASDVTVRYSTFDGTATQPGDYTATAATLTIPANSTTATIAVALTDDGFVEDAESFLLRLHDPTGLEIATADAVGVILDDDDLPTLDFDLSWPRVNEDVGTLAVPVSLNKVSDVEVRVDYLIDSPIPRTCDPAYVPQNGTLVFSPGAVVRSFEVTIVADGEVCAQNDRARKFRVQLSNPRNAVLGADNVQVYAWDVDQPAFVRSRGATVSESDGSAVVMVGLNRASNHDVTLTVETRGWVTGTDATPGLDYTALSAHTVTVPAGDRALLDSDTWLAVAVPVTIAILDNDIVEARESFSLAVVSVTGDAEVDCVFGFCARSAVHIDDDDTAQPPPTLTVGDVDIAESAGTALFVARLDRATNVDVSVEYATADGTATHPGDYTETAGTLTIEAGRTESYLEVPLVDDAVAEQAETFTLKVDNPVGVEIAVTIVTATIHDDDTGLPVLSIADATIAEDALAVDLMVSLSEASTEAVTFRWVTVEVPSLGDRSASPLSDYNASTPHSVTIPAGDTQGWARVWIRTDNVPERDEQFLVMLTDPVNAIVGDQQAWVTILNNDVPIVSIEDATASEGDDFVEFTLNLHAPAVEPGSIKYVTQSRASESRTVALPGEDYRTTSGTVAFAVGETTATAQVPINADTVDEPDESFLLVLSDPDLLATSDPVAVGTIVDDDPGFWIDDRSVWENAGSMVFTVQRDHTSASAVTVNYRIGTGGSATGGTACTVDGTDYKTPYTTPAGTVTMPAAATEVDISIEICNDDDPEGRENILVELTNVTGRQTTGVGTIVDDDRTDLPRINIGDSPSGTETVHATAGARFQISADGPLTEAVTVAWRTEDCLATDTQCSHPAAAGSDYTANSGTVTLTPTANSATVTVAVLNDTTHEDDEQFFVRLTGVTGPAAIGSGATHTDPVGIGFITDDDVDCADLSDPPPTIRVGNQNTGFESMAEALNRVGSQGQRFRVTLSRQLCDGVSGQIEYRTVDDTAVAGSDYVAASGTASLVSSSAEIRLFTVDDSVHESTEDFRLEVGWGPTMPQSWQSQADAVSRGRITDDD